MVDKLNYFYLYQQGVKTGSITQYNSVAFDNNGNLIMQAQTMEQLVQILDEQFDGRDQYHKIDGELIKRGHRGPSPRLMFKKISK